MHVAPAAAADPLSGGGVILVGLVGACIGLACVCLAVALGMLRDAVNDSRR